MDKLIDALQILLKYENPQFPIHCEHDTLYVLVNAKLVSNADLDKLVELGFFEEDGCFASYRYGSA